MANNFSDAQISLTDATLTDVFTASNKILIDKTDKTIFINL